MGKSEEESQNEKLDQHKDGRQRPSSCQAEKEAFIEASQKKGADSGYPLAGWACVALACLCNTTASAAIKLMTAVDTSLLVAWRGAVILAVASPAAIFSRRRKASMGRNVAVSRKDMLLLLARSACMSSSICFGYFAIRHMPLGDCRMITSSSPIFVALFAFFLLGQRCDYFLAATMTATALGVAVVLQPEFVFGQNDFGEAEENEGGPRLSHFSAGLFALAAAILQGLGAVATSALQDVDTFLISASGGLGGLLVGSLVYSATADFAISSLSWSSALWATMVGLMGFLTQILMISALKLDNASSMALARKSLDLLLAYGVQITFFDQIPTRLTVLGASIVASCVLLSGGKKVWEQKRRKNHAVDRGNSDHVEKPLTKTTA